MTRGLTLLELLVALCLVLALAAVAVPALDNVLDERSFETAADVVGQHLLLARSHAQSVREPIEVIYRDEHRRLEARAFQPGSRAMDASEMTAAQREGAGSDESGTALEMLAGRWGATGALREPWAIQVIPGTVRVLRDLPQPEEGPSFDAGPVDAAAPEILRIAVFLPDGSTLLGRLVWLDDGDGRLGSLALNPFTGLSTFERRDDLLELELAP